ncbi:MAG: glycosyltransferase family 4 protein [Akkermansiaceae bacterium]
MSQFEGKSAAVYVHNMTNLGGGERSALAFAKALTILGFNAEVVTMTEPVVSAERVRDCFGYEFEGAKISYREPREDGQWSGDVPDLFVNLSHANFMANPSPFGIYRLLFPVRPVLRENSPEAVENLCSYNMMLSNSSFTKQYADLMWDYPTERSYVLNSPLRTSIADTGDTFLNEPPVKSKKFVNIGRIETYKNQKLLIDAFLDARSRSSATADWQLVLIGNVANTENSQQYFKECQHAAEKSNGAVEIKGDVSHLELESELSEAFGYVHGMGAFVPAGAEPHLCEHFGQTIVEAMAHGCVPIVYARGGIFDVLDVGEGGIPYMTYEGLVEGFIEVAELWGTPEADDAQKKMIEQALDVRFERFTERLGQFIEKEMTT